MDPEGQPLEVTLPSEGKLRSVSQSEPLTMPEYRLLIDSLGYLPQEDLPLIEKAYLFAETAHVGQFRVSGEAYITHPLAVALMLAAWRMNAPGITAAILHDVMEDTETSKDKLADLFGREVAELVDGVSKLDRIEFASYHAAQAENFRKMMMSMAKDLRVVMIKFADRLHNLQTLAPFRPEKRRRIAHETLEIYAPIATRLGLAGVSRQLQDLSFMHMNPIRFAVLSKAIKAVRGSRRELFSKILEGLRARLSENKINASVFGREKSVYSTYHKMQERRFSFAQVADIYGFRVIVKDVPTCYMALGALHSGYKPIPGKIKDHIAIPKPNGYQSLHTTLIGPYGTPIEIQIRTQAMHHVAEDGIAAHWLYKDEDGMDLQNQTHKWLQALIESQGKVDSSEFLENIREDFFREDVYVFTPKGKILTLPRGATIIDFAYAVHSDVGNRCIAARVDHELIPLSTELSSGNQVEIITDEAARPSPDWLSYAKTGRARHRIRQFLRQTHQDGSSSLGEEMLHQELRAIGVDFKDIPEPIWDRLMHESGKHSKEDFFAELGMGRASVPILARQLAAFDEVAQNDTEAQAAPLIIKGIDGISIRLASCCEPIPREPIIGQLYQDQGLILHKKTCPVAQKMQETAPENWVLVDWAEELSHYFIVVLQVTVRNVRGTLGKVATAIADANVNIEQVSMQRNNSQLTDLTFTVQIATRGHLANLMRQVAKVPEVERVRRKKEMKFS